MSLTIGDTIQQVASVGVRYVWEFEGTMGVVIDVENNSSGMVYELYSNDGELIATSEVGRSLEGVILPRTDTYRLVGYADQYGGLFSFRVSLSTE
jgi:hypothetical protein